MFTRTLLPFVMFIRHLESICLVICLRPPRKSRMPINWPKKFGLLAQIQFLVAVTGVTLPMLLQVAASVDFNHISVPRILFSTKVGFPQQERRETRTSSFKKYVVWGKFIIAYSMCGFKNTAESNQYFCCLKRMACIE